MEDKQPDLVPDGALVPATPEEPFSSSRVGVTRPANSYGYRDDDRHRELSMAWVESPFERILWTGVSFLLVGMICFLLGLGFGSS